MHQDLLAKIEAYRLQHRLERTIVGIVLANDAHLIDRLEKPAKLRLRTIDEIEACLRRTPAQNTAIRRMRRTRQSAAET